MNARIIGNNPDAVRKYAKEKTAEEWKDHPMFVNACKNLASEMNEDWLKYCTKRQARRFKRGTGIVYNSVIQMQN